MTTRKVIANISLSLDGHYHGAGGPPDFGAFLPYVATDVARDLLTRVHTGATTAVLARGSAEGFLGYWAPLATDENADPRDRGYAKWLVETEKVILSTTLTEAPWPHARVVNAPAADVVTALKATGSGDILVNTSPSVSKPLLAADLVDRLHLLVCPEITGGGLRLFDDGLPATKWHLTHREIGEKGELALTYDRAR